MTREQIRIKITEACGWKYLWETECEGWRGNPPDGSGCAPIPNYPYDLNACHEMEKILNEDQREIYAQILTGMSLCDREGTTDWGGVFAEVAHATATQRCDAFLKTLES